MAFKILFTIAIYYNLNINQINMKMGFFYRLINQLVYIQILKNYETIANKGIVFKLLKAFYGVKQALKL